MEHSYKKRVLKNVTKGKLEGILESFMNISGEKADVQFMKESFKTNQKAQSRRAINFLESFMAIFGEKQRTMRIVESIK